MPNEAANSVKKRQVFYIPGYDPVPPRRYRELYRAQSREQADVSGYAISQKPRPKGLPNFGWLIDAEIDGNQTQTNFEILMWADIVQDSMELNIPRSYLLMAKTAWRYIGTGALFRLMQLRLGPILAALYPVIMLLAQLALALLAFAVLAGISGIWLHWTLSTALGTLGITAVLRWFKRNDPRFFAYYLMHDYGYSAQFGGANPPELEARMASFAAQISGALASDVDEVLVVGHSSGAHLGVSILSDVLRAGHGSEDGPRLGFLTLGQVIPMVSFLPKATRLRSDLLYLSQSHEITWVDVTAPGDGATFALCDPVAVSGVAPANQRHPLIVSAAFSKTLSPEKLKELGHRFFRIHFQYICAFDRPGDYDYFQITAGPRTLADRYRGRKHSPSRKTTAVNRYTSVDPE